MEFDNSILIALITFATSVAVAIITYSFNKKAQRLNEIRQMKINAYSNYIAALAKMAQNPSERALSQQYAIEANKVCLVASVKAVKAIQDFDQYIMRKDNYSIDIQTQLVTNIYNELRADLKMHFGGKIDLINLYRG